MYTLAFAFLSVCKSCMAKDEYLKCNKSHISATQNFFRIPFPCFSISGYFKLLKFFLFTPLHVCLLNCCSRVDYQLLHGGTALLYILANIFGTVFFKLYHIIFK